MRTRNTQVNAPSEIDLPSEYDNLSEAQKEALAAFIASQYVAARAVHASSSYGLKHAFEASSGGFYVTNGQFKGAMLAAGHAPTDTTMKNWTFRIKKTATTASGRQKVQNTVSEKAEARA